MFCLYTIILLLTVSHCNQLSCDTGDYSNQLTFIKCMKREFLFIRVYVAKREDFNLYHAPVLPAVVYGIRETSCKTSAHQNLVTAGTSVTLYWKLRWIWLILFLAETIISLKTTLIVQLLLLENFRFWKNAHQKG